MTQIPPADNPNSAPKSPPAPTAPPVDDGKIYALVIDDEFANRDFMMRLLQQTRIDVRGANSGKQALEAVAELGTSIVLVMLDHRLPDTSGIDLLKEIRPQLPEAKILMATMHDERSMMQEAFAEGCTGFMVKPHGFMELYKRIKDVTTDRAVLNTLDNLIFDQHGIREWRG